MKKAVSFSSKTFRSGNSKGERLGWVSLRDSKSANLKYLLSEREALKVNPKNEPILVP